MNRLTIHKINRVGENRLEYDYSVTGEWAQCFHLDEPMWAEYCVPVDQIPDSIAVLPLVGNVIVLASLMDAQIIVDEIDQDFYDCTEQFLQGFDTIMPKTVQFKLKNIIQAQKLVQTPLKENALAENLLFFSGGVDATCSLVDHWDEKPALLTVWGADIRWNDEEAWNCAIGFNREVAQSHGLKLLTVRSNFRKTLDDNYLDAFARERVNDWWWSAFHHSVAMMCLAAPLAAGSRSHIYFGSSYSSKDRKEWGPYVLASDPLIDNFVRFCGCQVVHDGYQHSRYDKIKRICEHYTGRNEKHTLRVCYLSNTGKNCGTCEKCASTIMSILLAGYSPQDFGLEYDEAVLPYNYVAGLQGMAREEKYSFLSLYYDVQRAFREKYAPEQVHPALRAFYDVDLEVLADFLYVPNNQNIAGSYKAQTELYRQMDQMQRSNMAVQHQKDMLEAELEALHNSTCWKITKPLRWLLEVLHRA